MCKFRKKKKRKYSEMEYSIQKLTEKYLALERRVIEIEKGNQKVVTHSSYWDKTLDHSQ